jgi:hypothetical protein
VRRSRFDSVGGFDESMRLSDDRNLTNRLWCDGAIFFLDPSWYVEHDMNATLRQHLRRYANYGRGIAVQLGYEVQPPDAEVWSLHGSRLAYWLRHAQTSMNVFRTIPGHLTRPWPERIGILALTAITQFAMAFGVLRSARQTRKAAQPGLSPARSAP